MRENTEVRHCLDLLAYLKGAGETKTKGRENDSRKGENKERQRKGENSVVDER